MTTKFKKTTKRGMELTGDVTTYRAVVDDGGIDAPPFANAARPTQASYHVRWGKPVPYVSLDLITAVRDGVATDPTALGGGVPETERQQTFVASLEAVFASHGFRRAAAGGGRGWLHRDHEASSYVFRELLVGSNGVFTTEATCGMHTVRYEIVDHASAQSILDAAADEHGMI